jgi:flagellar M-ring protein FliF
LKLVEWWKQLGGAQRIWFFVGLSAIVVVTGAFAYYALRPAYVPVADGLSAADVPSMVSRLDAAGVPYRTDRASGRILVRDDQLARARGALSDSARLSRQPEGFEVFDNSDFGMTEFSQRINYERGLEGELTRTIMSLDGVRFARLHLVLPQSSLFQRDQDRPKAAVMLMMEPGKLLSSAQIEGIRQLVAHAVPQLKPDRVSVLDHRGYDLTPSAAGDEAMLAATRNRMKAKEEVESYLAAKIYDVIGGLYPPGSVAVSVDVALRLDHVSSVRDDTLPKLVDSDLTPLAPTIKPAPPAGSGSSSSKQAPPEGFDNSNDYGITRLHQQIEEAPGAIKRLSVSVVVPDNAPQKLSDDELSQLIAGAVGADPERGDVVDVRAASVRTVPLDTTAGAVGAPPGKRTQPPAPVRSRGAVNISRSLLIGALGAAVGLILLLSAAFWGAHRHQASAPRLSDEERQALLIKVKEWLQQEQNATPGASG